jgi:hypothetical protein
MKCNGNFSIALNTLKEKARKAYFKINKLVWLNNPCKLLEKLFDTLISPILTYCSEIWSVFSNLQDSEPFEKLHLKFMKEILGVHCKASNDACRAELGRLLMKSKILFSCVKFLEHILHLDVSLVKDVFHATNQSTPWFVKVKDIFHATNQSIPWFVKVKDIFHATNQSTPWFVKVKDIFHATNQSTPWFVKVKDIFHATNQSTPWFVKVKDILQNLGFPFLSYNINLCFKTLLESDKAKN